MGQTKMPNKTKSSFAENCVKPYVSKFPIELHKSVKIFYYFLKL